MIRLVPTEPQAPIDLDDYKSEANRLWREAKQAHVRATSRMAVLNEMLHKPGGVPRHRLLGTQQEAQRVRGEIDLLLGQLTRIQDMQARTKGKP